MRGTIIPQNGIPWGEKENTNIQVPVEDKSDSENFDRYCQIVRDIYEQQLNILDAQHGVTPHRFYSTPSNGLPLPRTVPQWALPPNYMQHDYFQQQPLVTPEKTHRSYSADFRNTSIVQENDIDSFGVSNFIKLVPPIQDFILPKYDLPTPILKYTEEPLLSPPRNAHYNKEDNQTNFEAHLHVPGSKLPIGGTHPLIGSHCSLTNENQRLKKREDQFKRPACQNLYKNSPYDLSHESCKRRRLTSHSYESHAKHCENLSLPFGLVDSTDLKDSKTTAKEGSLLQRNTVIQKDHSTKLEEHHHKKFKYDCGLSKESDLAASIINQTSYPSILADPKQELLVNTKIVKSSNETDSNYEDCFKLHKYSLHLASPHLRNDEVKHLRNPSNADVNQSGVKKEHSVSQEVNKTEESTFHTVHKQAPTLWEDIEMSGQYPGHSRPPVGTPPPQTVWNHRTMTPGQVSGLNIHPTAMPGAPLNPAAFYAHQSMARATHLAPQLTPQLAHTQAPPSWHTPTVPSKSPGNASGNHLFSLQRLVDNRQNQNQYRNSANSQNTLDLSATSEVPENYSRIPQDIPISLTARSVDKGSRNGNIISPPTPLNGETSSDSGISSSVPTPNSVSEPVSLSTKEMITPKITVKNFDSNLKGVSNLHDNIKEMNADNFAQKVINLPPSVTIERVTTEKKESETIKPKDSLSVIAHLGDLPRNVIPVIVNFTSKMDKDVTDSPKRESSSERDKKIEETSVRSPKNLPKRGKKGVDSLLEKLEGGNKKLVCTENVGSVIVMPLEEKDTCSVKSMSPERQKSKSPNREDEVVSPAFSNDDSNDNAKQRRKRKLEKPVRLSKDSKTEVEDMELEPTEPTEPRICEPVLPEPIANPPLEPVKPIERVEERIEERAEEKQEESIEERLEENQPIRRRRSSEGPSVNQTLTNQRARRKSSDDVAEFSKVMSPKGVYNANPFNEVESELEKMFAGIVETNDQDIKKKEPREGDLADSEVKDDAVLKVENGEENLTAETPIASSTSVSSTIDIKLPNKKGKKAKARGGKRKISRSSENIFSTSGGDAPQKDNKKKRPLKGSKKQEAAKKTKKNTKIDGLREMAYDSGSNASSIRSRGPVVHVEGPRDSPLSVQVVNAPREEEEEKNKEKRKNVGNGTAGRSKRLSHQNDLDFRGKVSRAGLFSSTLSSRYDAHTTDSTWVCVFCKQGPHSIVPGDPSRPHPNLAGPHIIPGTYMVPSGVLSDLFGPYLIGKERLEEGILSADEQEVMTEQKKGGKNKRSLRYAGLADQFSAKMGKKKRNSVETSSNSLFTGMTLLPGEEQRWEVWLHEQCAIWAAGVYMAGGRVTGLQEAVWDAAKSVCGSCGLTGASIGCVKRGCKAVIHYPCALTRGWLLDTNQYIPKCNLHRVT